MKTTRHSSVLHQEQHPSFSPTPTDTYAPLFGLLYFRFSVTNPENLWEAVHFQSVSRGVLNTASRAALSKLTFLTPLLFPLQPQPQSSNHSTSSPLPSSDLFHQPQCSPSPSSPSQPQPSSSDPPPPSFPPLPSLLLLLPQQSSSEKLRR